MFRAPIAEIYRLVGGTNPAADDKSVFCESHYRHVADSYPDLVLMIEHKQIIFVDSITDLTRQASQRRLRPRTCVYRTLDSAILMVKVIEDRL
jgi:hypothetical protein